MMPDSIRSVWDSLSKPKKQDGYRAEQEVGTNWLGFQNYGQSWVFDEWCSNTYKTPEP